MIDKNNFGNLAQARDFGAGAKEGIFQRRHECAPLQIEDGDGRKFSRMPDRAALADDAGRIIERAQKSGFGQQQEIDFLLVPQMIAGSHDIDARLEDFSRCIDSDAGSARRIFPVGDDHVDLVGEAQFGEKLPHSVPARLPNDVADKKKLHTKRLMGNVPLASSGWQAKTR